MTNYRIGPNPNRRSDVVRCGNKSYRKFLPFTSSDNLRLGIGLGLGSVTIAGLNSTFQSNPIQSNEYNGSRPRASISVSF